jgi:uncharacterized membrane protein YedE/YeeE
MEYFSKEPLGKNQEALLKLYEQACENSRAYMDLRFKHFTTFMFSTGLVGAITFQVESLKSFRLLFCGVAIILTILFWLLDNRTSYHQKTEIIRIQYYENLIGAPMIGPPQTKSIKATLITNLIFLVILFSWTYMAYTLRYSISVQSQAIEHTKENNTNVQSPVVGNDNQKATGMDEQELKK